jgi:hypothetical protein
MFGIRRIAFTISAVALANGEGIASIHPYEDDKKEQGR